MPRDLWETILLSPGNEDQLWETFHENSKLGLNYQGLSEEEVLARMSELHESMRFDGYGTVDLPSSSMPLDVSLKEAIANRRSASSLAPITLTLETVATLLRLAYGVTRDNKGTSFSRPFRAVPSAGALYPLELFFYTAYTDNLPTGLYHYNPPRNQVRLLREGQFASTIARAMVGPNASAIIGASLIIFITAVFERSIFKYGDRGYRFIFLEAGHVAQNINLVTTGLNLGCLNIGGFRDRQVDDFLGLDGVTHSLIYLVAIGGKRESA